MRGFYVSVILVALAACGPRRPEAETRLPTVPITLPSGKQIRAEIATDPADQARGLMFRTHLSPDQGMLFVFPDPGQHPFWMYQTLIPLDIVWMDSDRRIVFVSGNTPPCPPESGQNCPNYGGQHVAQYVLELPAGAAAGYGLKPGDRLAF